MAEERQKFNHLQVNIFCVKKHTYSQMTNWQEICNT